MVTTDVGKKYTVAEYLSSEEGAQLKHEFYYGKLFEMPGTTKQHNKIARKTVRIFEDKLSGTHHDIFCLEVKVETVKDNVYLYPDVVIASVFGQSTSAYIVQNPILIVEILSDSTRKYDSTDKFIQYSKIESLQYYLLVEPEKHIVIFYEKLNGEWFSKPFTELTEEVKLPLFGTAISLGEIYG